MERPSRRAMVLTATTITAGVLLAAGIFVAATPTMRPGATASAPTTYMPPVTVTITETIPAPAPEVANDPEVIAANEEFDEALAEFEKFIGPGQHLVGVDMDPGTYTSEGTLAGSGIDCSWIRYADGDSSNNIVDIHYAPGPTRVTVQDGELFETQNCMPLMPVE